MNLFSIFSALLFALVGFNSTAFAKKAIILIGPPASGKGYLSEKIIAKSPSYKHISVGDILRSSSDQDLDDKMKSGILVPDEVVFNILSKYLVDNKVENMILDGVPRSKSQAHLLDMFLRENGFELEKIVMIECERDVLKKRMLHRKKKSAQQRPDDNEIVFLKRITLYDRNLPGLISYYNKRHRAKFRRLSCTSSDIYRDFRSEEE